jgi:hypothetical protein
MFTMELVPWILAVSANNSSPSEQLPDFADKMCATAALGLITSNREGRVVLPGVLCKYMFSE